MYADKLEESASVSFVLTRHLKEAVAAYQAATAKGDLRTYLADALQRFLDEGWQDALGNPLALEHGLSEGERIELANAAHRYLQSIQYLCDEVIDWNDPTAPKSIDTYLDPLIARAETSMIASRFMERERDYLAVEKRVLLHALKLGTFIGRIRESIARHGLSVHDAAPTVFQVAIDLEEEAHRTAPPTELTIGGEAVPITTPPALYASLQTLSDDIDVRFEAELESAVETSLQLANLPDIGTAASFEQSAFKTDRKYAFERVIESAFIARSDISGRHTNSRRQRNRYAVTGGLSRTLQRVAELTREAQSIHAAYTRARNHILDLKEREEEAAKRQRGRSADATAAPEVEFPIPEEFDGVTAYGLYLQDSVMRGDPLSVSWGQIIDYGEAPKEGGFVLSHDERNELSLMTLYAALSYASSHVVDVDELAQKVIANSGRGFMRERLRDVEVALRSSPHLTDEELEDRARKHLQRLVDNGTTRAQDMEKHMRLVDRMIDRVRAYTEVRRILSRLAIRSEITDAIISDVDEMPHARRFAKYANQNPLWLQKSFTGQSRLDLLSDVLDRVAAYRRRARTLDGNVHAFTNPSDRWTGDINRRLGRLRPPKYETIAHDPKTAERQVGITWPRRRYR